MLIRRQDLGVLFFHYLGYSKIKGMVLRLQHIPDTRFLIFHDILPESLDCFVANLNFLKNETNVVSLDDFLSGNLTTENINVVITFDDGFKGWISDAIPVLKKLHLPATFFISSGFIGLTKTNEAKFMQTKLLLKYPAWKMNGCLNHEDVKKLADEGFHIGGHTINHFNLAELRDKNQLRYEIMEDKLRLERMAGTNVNHFSYPFGAFQNPAIDLTGILREAGYRSAVTTVSGSNRITTNPYLLHREITSASMPEQVFKARTYGNYDAVRSIKKWCSIFVQHFQE